MATRSNCYTLSLRTEFLACRASSKNADYFGDAGWYGKNHPVSGLRSLGLCTTTDCFEIMKNVSKIAHVAAVLFAWSCWAWVAYSHQWLWLIVSVIPYFVVNAIE
jgi:hypothetical protein